MKVVICGSRSITKIAQAIEESPFVSQLTEVVHGACTKGVDREAQRWATVNKIKVRKIPADWFNLGKSAGPVRNRAMVLRYGMASLAEH